MSDLIKIAVDAMGGDGSPKKIVDGIILNNKSNKNVFYKIYGDQNQISELIKNKIDSKFYEVIHTDKVIKSTDSPLEGAKRGKETSMWLAIQSVKEKQADIRIFAHMTVIIENARYGFYRHASFFSNIVDSTQNNPQIGIC